MHSIKVLDPATAKQCVEALYASSDFGKSEGDVRLIKITIPPRSAFALHRHTGMEETFFAGNAHLLIRTFEKNADGSIEMYDHPIEPGDQHTVSPQTPHFVANETGEAIIAFAFQRITQAGGQTVFADFFGT